MGRQPIGFTAPQETAAVFVRVPVAEAEKLDRAAFALKRPKREIVAALLSSLETEQGRLVLGRAYVPRVDPETEVLTPEQAAELLQVEAAMLLELAERGELPARKVGSEWRFSRAALLDWLAGR
jgi:excisionase family DNA binding protein